MSRSVYLNGDFIPVEEAKVSIFDRGLLFADSVYEVMGVLDGKLVDFDGHVQRLELSLNKLDMPMPLSRDEILGVQHELIRQNGLHEGLVYMQVTRGTAERDFAYGEGMTQTVFMFHQQKDLEQTTAARVGAKMLSVPDIRWDRRDIKSTGLLAQVLAKQAAKQAGCAEALMVMKDGTISEGGSSSFYFIKDDVVVTRPISNDILAGITRQALLQLAETTDIRIEERSFSLDEVFEADEAFITAASTMVCPIIEIDERRIGGGQPGPLTKTLRDIYFKNARQTSV